MNLKHHEERLREGLESMERVLKDRLMWKELAESWERLYHEAIRTAQDTGKKVADTYEGNVNMVVPMHEELDMREEAMGLTYAELADAIVGSLPLDHEKTFLDWIYSAAAKRLYECEINHNRKVKVV